MATGLFCRRAHFLPPTLFASFCAQSWQINLNADRDRTPKPLGCREVVDSSRDDVVSKKDSAEVAKLTKLKSEVRCGLHSPPRGGSSYEAEGGPLRH